MPSTPTPLLGVEQQAAGENLNVWGDPNLNQALQRLTEAIAQTTTVTSYPTTLSSTNYVQNQARNMILICQGVGGTITIPGQSKLYILRNASSGNVVITTGGGANATVASGDSMPVICDGANCYTISRTDFQNVVLKNVANGVNPLDAANKQQIDAVLAAAQAYTDATAFASASLPGQAGFAGYFLQTNGTNTLWAQVYPAFSGTTDYILSSTGTAATWSSPAQIRTKLSLGGAALLNVGTSSGTVAAGNDSRIVNAAQLSGAVFVGAISGPSATFTTFNGALAGNASTASAWQTARTLSLTGDGTASLSVNGAADVSGALTLANSGVTAGSYGPLTIDAKGRVTAAGSSGYVFARATVNGSTGALISGYNVASASKVSTGRYDIVFTNAAATADYTINVSPQSAGLMAGVVNHSAPPTVNGCSVKTWLATPTPTIGISDCDVVHIVVMI